MYYTKPMLIVNKKSDREVLSNIFPFVVCQVGKAKNTDDFNKL